MDLDSFLVSLYVLVDDWWQEHHSPKAWRPGRPAAISAYLADNGYSFVEWEKHWLKTHGALVAATPQRTAKRA